MRVARAFLPSFSGGGSDFPIPRGGVYTVQQAASDLHDARSIGDRAREIRAECANEAASSSPPFPKERSARAAPHKQPCTDAKPLPRATTKPMRARTHTRALQRNIKVKTSTASSSVESRASHAVGTFSNPDEGKGRQGFATRLRQRDDAPHPPVPQWELLGCLYCIRCSNNKEERLFSSLGMGAGAQKNTFCRRSGNVGEGGGVTFRADVSFTAPPGNYAKSRVKGGGMGGAGRGRSSTHRGRDYRFHLSPYATGPN